VHFDTDEMIREYTEWMRDNWNHPSVVIWDANNETWDPAFGEKIIPQFVVSISQTGPGRTATTLRRVRTIPSKIIPMNIRYGRWWSRSA